MRKSPNKLQTTVMYTLFALTFAFVSLAITGFKFGIYNNVFHIPYVLSLSESQEFLGDAFYSSLKHFTSIIWLALRLVILRAVTFAVFWSAILYDSGVAETVTKPAMRLFTRRALE
jgi:hypothetical protein